MFRWPGWVRAALMVLLVAILLGVVPSSRPILHAQGGGSLGYGSKILGRLSAELPEVVYSFNGTSGDLVQVRVRNWVGTLNPQVALIAPDGTNAATSTRSPFAVERQNATLALYLPQTGAYMLVVSAENGTSGQFMLTLDGRSVVSAAALTYGEGRDVVVPPQPPPQYFALDTGDCPTVLTVSNLSEGLPFTFLYMVKVRNPLGHLIALLYGGDAVEDRLMLPARSGRYEIEVRSEDPTQQGTIQLLASCAEQAPGCVGGDAGGATSAETGTAAECPSCFSEDFGGDMCSDFEIAVAQEGDSTFAFSWPAVDGATYYIFSITDAWGELLADSAIMLEGETSHRYTFQPADFGRGPFTAHVNSGSEGEASVLLCAGEVSIPFEEPPTEACTGIDTGMDIVPGEARVAVAHWSSAPGAAAYLIHVYAYGDDGGLIGIRVLTVPGDTTTYHLEGVFPTDYSLFHIEIGAYGEESGGGAFGDMPQGYLCSGGTDVEFPKTGPVHWGPAA